jgi:hypothetical protein
MVDGSPFKGLESNGIWSGGMESPSPKFGKQLGWSWTGGALGRNDTMTKAIANGLARIRRHGYIDPLSITMWSAEAQMAITKK